MFPCVLDDLAPKVSKFQQQMATTIEGVDSKVEKLTKQLESFQSMMGDMLEKLRGIETWRGDADKSFGALLQRTSATSIDLGLTAARLEARPPPPPLPSTQLSPQPAAMLPQLVLPARNVLDLNIAPEPTRPSASSGEQPSGHYEVGGESGSILGTFPPPLLQGTSHDSPQSSCHARDDSMISLPRSAPYPKLEFPKFSGENPRWWRDQCEMYFEVYAVHPALKTRFAALNFTGPATTWLQTIERKG